MFGILASDIGDIIDGAELVESASRHQKLDEDFRGADREIEFNEPIGALIPDPDELRAQKVSSVDDIGHGDSLSWRLPNCKSYQQGACQLKGGLIQGMLLLLVRQNWQSSERQ
jgi:hypothetical protein